MRNRREILKVLAAAVVPALARLDCPGDVRPYRADAVIMLGSLPIYRRRGVGSGYAVCRRLEGGGGARWLLGFAGGSWPERAKGLNRLGYYREIVSDGGESALRGSYFGFLSVSHETDLAEARRSVHASGPVAAFSVIEGQVGEFALCRTARFAASAGSGWPQWSSLLPAALAAVRSATASLRDSAGAGPFLHAVREAILSPESHGSRLFAYGGYLHRLETAKRPAPHLAERFGGPIVILSGTVHSGKTGGQSRFKLWLEAEPGAVLPLRIELQPRSFLRLSFEYDPGVVAQDLIEQVPFSLDEDPPFC
jgi:hypothetical protein